MRVAFAGTPEFATIALRSLHAAGFEIALVLTQPDRPAGRGLQLQPSSVKTFAAGHGIAVAQPRSLRLDGKFPGDAASARSMLDACGADVIVVAAYGLLLPQWLLDTPRWGCLNIHASLLPRWRGAAPIHRAIEAGDAQTGITIMRMDAGLDTGAVLLARAEPIAADDTAASLHDRLALLGGSLIVDALRCAGAGSLTSTAQATEGVTYAAKIDKAEATIVWSATARHIERRIRAFDPYPGASTAFGNELIKCWHAELASGQGAAGLVLDAGDAGITVACGQGALRLTELQRPGGRRLPAGQFLQGRPIAVGTVLGRAAS